MNPGPEVLVRILEPGISVPARANSGDAGFDLCSAEEARVEPGERQLIRTGIAVAIPSGFAGYVQPRSGLAIKKGLGVLNSPGLIDSGYRGEISVIVFNQDAKSVIQIAKGDRIAQLVILAVPEARLVPVNELPESERGSGGFGSTGT